jgi:glucosamine--fructose-6-phosphate aminotransferase (isomerizing)
MNKDEVLIWVDPAPENEPKFEEVLCKNVGVKIVAISTRTTRFPTLRVKNVGDLTGYVALAMGWNLLMSCGVSLGIDVDKPERARKVGNEVVEQLPPTVTK